MILSIVVGTRNRPDIYKRFLGSVVRCATVESELVVGDATQEKRYAQDDYFRLTCNAGNGLGSVLVLHESPPLGMIRGYNRCFRECRGEWVAWFNEDCELLPGWDKAAVDFLSAHPEVGLGAVYFKDRNEDGTYTDKFRVYEYPPMVPHANFGVLRRELGDKIGWFDERLGWGYGSDTALGLQVIEAGYAVARIPDCKCIHHRAWDVEMSANHEKYRGADLVKFKELWLPKYLQMRQSGRINNTLSGPEYIE